MVRLPGAMAQFVLLFVAAGLAPAATDTPAAVGGEPPLLVVLQTGHTPAQGPKAYQVSATVS
jgi:hypothetical protein